MANNEKATTKAATKAKTLTVLEKVGKAIIREHGYEEVYVTADGQAFHLESDAKNHAANLSDREITKVKK